MAGKRFYGVRNHPDTGKNGVYDNWDACSAAVRGASGVQYKGFSSWEEAESFAGVQAGVEKPVEVVEKPVGIPAPDPGKAEESARMLRILREYGVITEEELQKGLYKAEALFGTRLTEPEGQVSVYVDGSYNAGTKTCGYGIYVRGAGQVVPGRGGQPEFMMCGGVPESSGGRNVEGEVTAAWLGLDAAAAMAKPGAPIVVYHDYEGIGKWADGAWARNKDYTAAYAAKVAAMRRDGLDVRFEHVKGHTGNTGNELVDDLAKIGCDVPGDYKDFWDQYGRPFIAAGAVPRSGIVHDLDVPVHLGAARDIPDVPARQEPDGQLEF